MDLGGFLTVHRRVTFEPADQISSIHEGLGELDGLGRGFKIGGKICSEGAVQQRGVQQGC